MKGKQSQTFIAKNTQAYKNIAHNLKEFKPWKVYSEWLRFFLYISDLDVLLETLWQQNPTLQGVNIVWGKLFTSRHFGETIKKFDASIDFCPCLLYFASQNLRGELHAPLVFAHARKHCLTQMSLYTSNNALSNCNIKNNKFYDPPDWKLQPRRSQLVSVGRGRLGAQLSPRERERERDLLFTVRAPISQTPLSASRRLFQSMKRYDTVICMAALNLHIIWMHNSHMTARERDYANI